MSSGKKQGANAPIADDVLEPPIETSDLRKGLRGVMATKFFDPASQSKVRVGSFQFGVYAFYDYDGEPIYVGQTREKLSGRVSRHLTNQRTDAVAMSVLDPFEVCDVEVWPLPLLQGLPKTDDKVITALNELEATIYTKVLQESKFHAVLNEKIPIAPNLAEIPASVRGRIVTNQIMELRSHPDIRLARRAATLARLAQIISERKVSPGLRHVLVVQSERLEWLAKRRYERFKEEVEAGHEPEEKVSSG